VDGVSRRFVDALWLAKADFHAALPSEVAIFEHEEPTDKQHQIPLIKGSKNVEFHALRAIFRVASANSTNKGHRDNVDPGYLFGNSPQLPPFVQGFSLEHPSTDVIATSESSIKAQRGVAK
jgi:hypothetical protein